MVQSENEFQIELKNDFKAHGLRSMGLLELATDEHGKTRMENQEWIPAFARMTKARCDGSTTATARHSRECGNPEIQAAKNGSPPTRG